MLVLAGLLPVSLPVLPPGVPLPFLPFPLRPSAFGGSALASGPLSGPAGNCGCLSGQLHGTVVSSAVPFSYITFVSTG